MLTKTTMLQYIENIERQLEALRQAIAQFPEDEDTMATEPPADHRQYDAAAELQSIVSVVNKETLRPLIDAVFEKMGICGEPIGAEKVQEMIAACGVRPEDNAFSQGIIDMREE